MINQGIEDGNIPIDPISKELSEAWKVADKYDEIAIDEGGEWSRRQAGIEGKLGTEDLNKYVSIPVAGQICKASASLLFSQAPIYTSADPEIQAWNSKKIKAHGFNDKFLRGAELQERLGSCYLRVLDNPESPKGRRYGANLELIKFQNVIPYFSGDELVAAIVIKHYDRTKAEGTKGSQRAPGQFIIKGNGTFFTHFEILEIGKTTNLLFRGDSENIGKEVDLSELDVTSGIQRETETGVDHPLIVFLPQNQIKEGSFGTSGLAGLEDLLLNINESATMLQDRVRVSAPVIYASEELMQSQKTVGTDGKVTENRKTLHVPNGPRVVSASQTSGATNAGRDLLEITWPEPGLEEFETHKGNDINTALEAAGIAPQALGRSVDGTFPESGKARELQMANTLANVGVKARAWESTLSEIMTAIVELDIARGLVSPTEGLDPAISVDIREGFPETQSEKMERVQSQYVAGLISLESSLKEINPMWSDEEITIEAERIDDAKAVEKLDAVSVIDLGVDTDSFEDDLGAELDGIDAATA